jgi:penicillin-binding protein 2
MTFPVDGNREDRPLARLRFMQFSFIAVFVVYTLRLFSMQILSGDVYRTRAERIARRTTVIPAQRGEIYDRNYNIPMVLNIDSFAVTVVPAEIPKGQISTVFARLSDLLGIPQALFDKKVPPAYYHLYQSIELVSNVSVETISMLAERSDELPGISWQSKPIRSYVDTGSLAHIIGYVGDITREELKVLYNKGYELGDIIGKAGIEKQYDEVLRGKAGQEVLVVDVRGRKIEEDIGNYGIAPEMGKNIVLSIDRNIQELAEEALGERMGAVIVMKPGTGEILAMVSYPWYDPNIFNQTGTGNAYQAMLDDPKKPFLNRAIQSSYPPASTFKVIMSTGILEEKAFSPDKTVDCDGEILYGDRIFRCHIRKPGHGPLDLRGALAQSCDVYFWIVSRDNLGIERIVSYAKDFGFGSLTEVDLPGEISGFVPTPQWKERRFHEKWLGGDTMNMSIGQGYTLTTPLQMANMISMIVNDGVTYRPTVLKEIRDPVSGAMTRTIKPTVLRRSSVVPETFAAVRRNMRSVVSEGTARFPLNIKSVQIAGKTGTAEVGLADHWHSWFASFAPFETTNQDERVVVSVIVEASNPWEWWAPYASAIIYQGIFAEQTYEESIKALGFQNLSPLRERRE